MEFKSLVAFTQVEFELWHPLHELGQPNTGQRLSKPHICYVQHISVSQCKVILIPK